MEFPKVLAFNVQTDKPFGNERYYARRIKNTMNGLQSFEIHDAVGDMIGRIHLPHHKPFDSVLTSLRRSAASLAALKGFNND